MPELAPELNSRLEETLSLMRAGQLDRGMAALETLLPQIEATGHVVGVARCHLMRSVACQQTGRLKEALLYGQRSLDVFRSSRQQVMTLRALAAQALTFALTGDAPEAHKLLNDAIDILHTGDLAPALHNIFWNNAGAVYETLGQLPQAIAALQRVDLSDPIVGLVGRANIVQLQVTMAMKLQPPEPDRVLQALSEHVAHIGVCAAAGVPHLVAGMADFASNIYLDMGLLAQARKVIATGVESMEASGGGPLSAALDLHLARAARLSGETRTALPLVSRALASALAENDRSLAARCHLEASRLHEARGEWCLALESHKQYAGLEKALLEAKADTVAQAMSARLEYERQRIDAELLRIRNQELQQHMAKLSVEAGELKRQAMEDPLTGLANRRQFESEVRRLRQSGRDVVFLLGDIDHFKRINDNWSHAVGDEVLKQIGELLRLHSRPDDVAARLGGEEFVLALAGLSIAQAAPVAERLRQAIMAHDWSSVGAGLAVTISLGLAGCGVGESTEQALERADAAMYTSKRLGRNQVQLAAPAT